LKRQKKEMNMETPSVRQPPKQGQEIGTAGVVCVASAAGVSDADIEGHKRHRRGAAGLARDR
jgi:hypothetical protein